MTAANPTATARHSQVAHRCPARCGVPPTAWGPLMAWPRSRFGSLSQLAGADHDADVVTGHGHEQQDHDHGHGGTQAVALAGKGLDVLPNAEGDDVEELGVALGQVPDL